MQGARYILLFLIDMPPTSTALFLERSAAIAVPFQLFLKYKALVVIYAARQQRVQAVR
jgi:hypothetical protein